MGLFDIFKKKKEITVNIRDLIVGEYAMQYSVECDFIRDHYMNGEHTLEILQGELLRQMQLLKKQAMEQGNAQWNGDYVYYCDFIKRTLCNMSVYSEEDMAVLTVITDYLKYCGENGIAYTGENLYARLFDFVGKLQNVHPDAIVYEF